MYVVWIRLLLHRWCLDLPCWIQSRTSLATGTSKLNAHVLTERLSKRSLLPNKLRCLLDWWRAGRQQFLLASHAARVASFVHCRTRGCEAIRHFSTVIYVVISSARASRFLLRFLRSFRYHPASLDSSSARVALMLKLEHSSCDRGKCSCWVDCLIIY